MLGGSTDDCSDFLHSARTGCVIFVFGIGGDLADGLASIDREGKAERGEVGSADGAAQEGH